MGAARRARCTRVIVFVHDANATPELDRQMCRLPPYLCRFDTAQAGTVIHRASNFVGTLMALNRTPVSTHPT